MSNSSINHKTNSETPYIHQVVNTYPEQQSLTLQNTNKDLPIQLRVDPVTDYTALWVTLGVSVLVSSITAFVTIWLITRSNQELSASQLVLQEKMLLQQEILKKNEVKAQNRQEWINNVREIFVNYFSHTHKLSFILQRYFTAKIAYSKKHILAETYNKHTIEYQEYVQALETLKEQIDITLSAKDKLDRRISRLVGYYCKESTELFECIESELENTPLSETIRLTVVDIEQNTHYQKSKKLNIRISRLIKFLLKKEWEKVKSFE